MHHKDRRNKNTEYFCSCHNSLSFGLLKRALKFLKEGGENGLGGLRF